MLEESIFKSLKILRGNRTQREMSNLLRAKPDDYHKWESGYKKIKLQEFISLLKLCGYDFEKICTEDFLIIKRERKSASFVKQLESHFACNLNSFLNSSKISESKWWRLKNQESDLTVLDFFKIIHFRSYLLYKLLDRIGLQDYQLENTKYSPEDKLKIFNNYMLNYNFFPAFTAALYLKEVVKLKTLNSKSKIIAQLLGEPASLILEILNDLLDHEILIKDTNGNLDFTTFENNYGAESKMIGQKIYTSIFTNSLRHAAEKSGDHKAFYRVAPVSIEAFTKIQRLQAALSKEIYNIILNDPADNRTEIIQTFATSFRN